MFSQAHLPLKLVGGSYENETDKIHLRVKKKRLRRDHLFLLNAEGSLKKNKKKQNFVLWSIKGALALLLISEL